MSEGLSMELNEEGPEVEETFQTESCFGEHGEWENCPRCELREKCKKFTEAERRVAIRSQGKYSSRGKEKGKDRY